LHCRRCRILLAPPHYAAQPEDWPLDAPRSSHGRRISLYNQHADFELGSDSNSNSTSPWAIAFEPAIEPSCADSPLHEHFPYDLCIAIKAHAKALSARRAGKEIASEYDSDSNPIFGYY
jgi:hypothetical protein